MERIGGGPYLSRRAQRPPYQEPGIDRADNLSLRKSITDYERQFTAIESEARRLAGLFQQIKKHTEKRKEIFPLVKRRSLNGPSGPLNSWKPCSFCRAAMP
jgi:hypothetical protein